MDDVTRKVLRRACAQYKTGIRKPFGVNGHILRLTNDYTFTNNEFVGLKFEDVQDRYNVEVLEEVTPEAIMTAIATFAIREVMES